MNIPSSLLFQNERISSIYEYSPQGFYIVLGIFVSILLVVLTVSYLRKKKKVLLEKTILPPIIPELHDAHFEVKMAKYLRYIIYQIASPKHTYAHTAREIRHYMNDKILVDTLSNLERAEYNCEALSEERKKEIISLAQKYSIIK